MGSGLLLPTYILLSPDLIVDVNTASIYRRGQHQDHSGMTSSQSLRFLKHLVDLKHCVWVVSHSSHQGIYYP